MLGSPRVIFAAGLLVWTANAAIVWLSGATLGHDEAQYTLAARDLLAGQPARWFWASTGTSWLAVPGVLLGGSEIALRLVPFLFGIGFVLAAAGLARCLFGAPTAAWVTLVLAGMRPLVKIGADLLSDLPATAALLAGAAVLAGEILREDGPRRRIVLAAPLLAAALYLRYASCVPIAILGAAVLAVGGRSIARRPGPVIAAAALFCALLVPHALAALDATGSPLGILLASKGVPRRAWMGEGLATYVTANPFLFYGVVAAPVLVAGLVAIRRFRERRVALLWIVAVADIVALGLLSHAQARYIAFGIVLLLVLGVDEIRGWIAAQAPPVRGALVAAAVAAVGVSYVMTGLGQVRHRRGRDASLRDATAAAAAIRGDAAGARCYVHGVAPMQLEWYSGCRGTEYPWVEFAGGEIVYLAGLPAPPEWQGRCRDVERGVVRCES